MKNARLRRPRILPRPSSRFSRRRFLGSLGAASTASVVAGWLPPGTMGCTTKRTVEKQKQPPGEIDRPQAAALVTDRKQAASTSKPRSNMPHVLFISLDDLNDWIGVLGGHPQTRTPNIDALAASGVLFANAHCAAPACNPSRVATMTGLRPSTTGIYGNKQPWRQALPDVVTLPAHFREQGYRVIGSGKLFHGSYLDPKAWDAYHPSRCEPQPPSPRPPRVPASGVQMAGPLDWGPVQGKLADEVVVDWAIRRMAESRRDPLFLGVGLSRPHLPWFLPRKYFEAFDVDDIVLPEVREDDRDDIPPIAFQFTTYKNDSATLAKHGLTREAVRSYLAAIAFSDAMIGRLLEGLARSPIADETIVVLWSDHGWHLGEKLHWRKYTLWEEATRVPLVFRVPGSSSGTTCQRAVNLLDVYPTLNELCGVPQRPELEGRSLVSLLERPDAPLKGGSVTTWKRGNHSVRTERWRFTRYRDGSTELYDHDSDPNEWTNLAGRARFDDVMKELAAQLPKRDAPPAPAERDYDAAALACDDSV